ncbi:MAG TPA: TPM domain-containing protein [Thermoanaerobaculia bacterium]|nr:TPM domain-containing protein [Thermoanaerobaculia bacterium]
MRGRIVGAAALLALWLGASVATGADAPPVFAKALPPAPSDPVTDAAGIFPAGARARLDARLRKFADDYTFVRLYLYTLKDAAGAPPQAAAQELYRRWRMRDRELYDGLATIFVFSAERKALVMLGQGAPPPMEAALDGVAPDLEALFGPDPAGALSRVVDRIGAGLRQAETTSWLDPPPVPAEPSGPLHGNPPFSDDGVTGALEETVRKISTAEHPIVLVLNPAKGMDSPAERAEKLAAAWPDRILLVCFSSDFSAFLFVPEPLRERFPEEQRRRLVREVGNATTNRTFPRTLTRVLGEVATLAEGRTPEPWVEWKHPLHTLGGGQDGDPAPPAVGFAVAAGLLGVVGWLLYTLVTRPKVILALLVQGAIQGLIGGVFGGAGGAVRGFFSGGGSFGGGGASGKW